MKKIYDTPSIEMTVFDSTEITNVGTSAAQVNFKKVSSLIEVDAIDF